MGVSETGQRYSHTISRISTFDFLRIVGMVMIFFNHSWAYLPFSITDFGARGVELFLLLSGFLLTYNYYDKVQFSDVKSCARFAIQCFF